ncbi:MAG TPA: hypothetical protein VJL59_24360 [Anaerolineales bacterium]|nr:hypothetical protein [Anaerolineales bacterium]
MPKRKRQHPHAHLLRLLEAVNVPQPNEWPGANDPSLARPDMIKFDYAESVTTQETGKSKLKRLEDDFQKGAFDFVPDIKHWAMEEFFWHGLPGDDWHPLESFLNTAGERFSPPAQEQLRRWKEARVGLFEVGDIQSGTVNLQEWDTADGAHCGPPLRAITLNIGGVNAFRNLRGQVALMYLAPWNPTEGLYCGMGYSATVKKREIGLFELLRNALRHPDIASRKYSWNESREAAHAYLREWKMREWHGWLKERLSFPFRAVIQTRPDTNPQAMNVTGLMPMTPADVRQMGIYFEVPTGGDELIIAGATMVVPLDIESPNWLPIAEYQAYRAAVGPPPGTRGQPAFVRLR